MRFVNFGMVHVGSEDESSANEGKYETYCDRGDEKFEGEHVAAADALRRPGAVMIEILNAIVAEAAMLREHILSPDDLALLAEFITTKIQFKKVKKSCWTIISKLIERSNLLYCFHFV